MVPEEWILAIVADGHCSMTMAMHSSGEATESARDRWLSVLLSLSIQLQPAHRFTDGAAVVEGATVGAGDTVGASDAVGAGDASHSIQ